MTKTVSTKQVSQYQEFAKTLKSGMKCMVSYKGLRPATFKNFKGACAFIEFDSGDGTGVRLHRVLATTLKPMPKAEPKAKATKPVQAKAADINALTDEMLLRALADRLGFTLVAKN